ncbi:lysozyme inhibitor LprI family protein [Psychrobacter ciconiae]|uniref:lysozyme inhibitor LprI family protein n=1 Tax=Psychrobacter ciconiae TaxID=1553449 RepID=UPI00191B689D|nr:lysozyme inhibitor LprI family protein [Psychrobacter ciconiae]
MTLVKGILATIGTLGFSVAMMSSAQAAGYNCEMLDLETSSNCGTQAVAKEKKRLNDIYKRYHNTLSAPQKAQLDKEQRAWLKKRNANCAFDESGAMNNMMVWEMIASDVCTANETQKRTNYIMGKMKKR